MANPFQYGGVVTGESFCNRKVELADLERAVENGEKLFVYSQRRLGKTSLLRRVLEDLPQRNFLGIYVDLWPTESETTFAATTAKAISQASATTATRMLETAKQLFTRLVPSVSVNEEGRPTVSFGAVAPHQTELELEEVLQAPEKLAARERRRVVVVFDEIQRILEYESDFVERKLRSVIQHQPEVSYIFLGSRKHLIRQMFLEQSRPLYRSAGHYPLGPIAEEDWMEFIQTRFEQAEKSIGEDTVREICRLTEGHPFYTQHLCHVLWERTEVQARATIQSIESALSVLLDRERFAYATLWESLTPHQRRFLTGLAREKARVRPFSAAFTKRYGLRSASNAQRASQALLKRDLIDPEDGSFVIADRFFRLWILRLLSETDLLD